jgi:hypothetical protein
VSFFLAFRQQNSPQLSRLPTGIFEFCRNLIHIGPTTCGLKIAPQRRRITHSDTAQSSGQPHPQPFQAKSKDRAIDGNLGDTSQIGPEGYDTGCCCCTSGN